MITISAHMVHIVIIFLFVFHCAIFTQHLKWTILFPYIKYIQDTFIIYKKDLNELSQNNSSDRYHEYTPPSGNARRIHMANSVIVLSIIYDTFLML